MSIIKGNWDIQVESRSLIPTSRVELSTIELNFYKEFEKMVQCRHQNISDSMKDGFTVQEFFTGDKVQNSNDELKTILELNKQLRVAMENKLEELSKQKVQYENYKKDQKLLSQGIKETHEAFLMAKKCYKKFLKIYYTIESRNFETQTIFLQFFTEAKKESESYSIRLLRDIKSGRYQLISTTPQLDAFMKFQRQLQETNDVSGALCCIRQVFMNMKKSKNNM